MYSHTKNVASVFCIIDSCLFSKDDHDANNLYICTPQLMNLSLQIPDDHKLNIAMMHHGVAFLNGRVLFVSLHQLEILLAK